MLQQNLIREGEKQTTSIFGLIVGGTSGIVLMAFLTINRITNLERENKELKKALDNAEYRATKYARTIKKIEDIYFGRDTIVNKYNEIGKILKREE